MSSGALEVYERSLARPAGVRVRFGDGSVQPLPVDRYLAPADPHDRGILDGVTGPVLDVGCGPGRHLHALAARGVDALGVDLSPAAVRVAKRGGGHAVVGDVFGDVPGGRRWATALLLDGNIGIGGRPQRLLARLGRLLIPGGVVLAEVERPGATGGSGAARIETDDGVSGWFPWARVSASEIGVVAASAGLNLEMSWRCGERWFVRLRSRPGA